MRIKYFQALSNQRELLRRFQMQPPLTFGFFAPAFMKGHGGAQFIVPNVVPMATNEVAQISLTSARETVQ